MSTKEIIIGSLLEFHGNLLCGGSLVQGLVLGIVGLEAFLAAKVDMQTAL